MEFPNPLLEIPLKEEGGEIIIPGNRALINLNLSSTFFCCKRAIKKGLTCSHEKTKTITKSFHKGRACLLGGGGPQVGEVTRLGGVTRLFI